MKLQMGIESSTIQEQQFFLLHDKIKMPKIGLGTYLMKDEDVYQATIDALKIGYRHIDTARGYRNEDEIAKAIKDSGVPRSEIFITSKLSPKEQGYDEAKAACLNSCSKFDGYLDLFLIHWPGVQNLKITDPENLERRKGSWKALEGMYTEGKCKAIGVSNYTVRHLEEMLLYSKIMPSLNQVEIHPKLYPAKLIEFGNQHNIVTFAYSSLGCGHLVNDPIITEVAKAKGKTQSQVLLRWAIQKGTGVIPKSKTKKRIEENFKISEFELTPEEMEKIDKLGNEQKRYCWDPTEVF